MHVQKPLYVIGVIGIFGVITVVAFVQSLWHSTLYSRAVLQQDRVGRGALETDSFTTPAWQVYRPDIRSTDPLRGSEDAEVDIVEYGDFQCPYCAQVQATIDEVMKKYEGRVRLVWKDFPNPLHPQARPAALAARCAQAQGKFWEYHDYLFANQGTLGRSTYSQVAKRLGLVMARFDACVDAAEKVDLIGQTIDEAQLMDVDGTPHFLINGRRLPYAGTYEEFEGLIESALRG